MQDYLHLSERSTERLFREHFGISPKLFVRISRFQASLQMIRNKTFGRLSDVALGEWYADQSHFNREFREFTGTTPRLFLRNAHEQVENFPEWIS